MPPFGDHSVPPPTTRRASGWRESFPPRHRWRWWRPWPSDVPCALRAPARRRAFIVLPIRPTRPTHRNLPTVELGGLEKALPHLPGARQHHRRHAIEPPAASRAPQLTQRPRPPGPHPRQRRWRHACGRCMPGFRPGRAAPCAAARDTAVRESPIESHRRVDGRSRSWGDRAPRYRPRSAAALVTRQTEAAPNPGHSSSVTHTLYG